MERREGWEHWLAEFLFKRKDTPFKYGANDCCLFVCDAVEQMTGVDPAVDYRGKYSTKREAFDLIDWDIEGHMGDLFKTYGMTENGINHAGRGDVALVNGPMGDALGVIDMTGERVALPAKTGLMYFPKDKDTVKKTWRVG